MTTSRLFLGVPLPAHWLDALAVFKSNNTDFNEKCKWVKEQNLHITTLFIGDFPRMAIPDLLGEINMVCNKTNGFELELENIVLKKGYRNSMIWAQFKEHPGFSSLHEQLHQYVNGKNALHEFRKQLIPHITLARIKAAKPQNNLIFEKSDFPKQIGISQINLWESKLNPSGAVYLLIRSFNLSRPIP
jgi:2'-5' RNA ligase